ncbi:uncharacterized protein TM35_000032110 [Trypanosoma theileri]|uniref:Uncharacterized protein n=1 Tax=Trypanosoma theileri TaxID=67003 RepID=A0A1X0P6G9_9TRYP|nr:uncharacterized protein TM35_000032110 [Trypanosoma theileri]ORC92458.1 hypothetical protein TM35_000032110 [Trypanosoma theileri]
MYLGPWEEYRILKAMENLREKNEQMREETTGKTGGASFGRTIWGPDADRSSSHHFPLNLDAATTQDTTLVDSIKLSQVSSTPSAPRIRLKKKNTTKPKKGLRFLMKVRDVDVYTEEDVASTTSIKSSESSDTLSCSDGTSEVRRQHSNFNKTNSECDLRGNVRNTPQVETISSGSSIPMSVHVELGTGRVIRKPQLQTIPNVLTEESSRFLQSSSSQSRNRSNQPLLEFIRGAPLDTKSKYERAGQPLLERQTEKNRKKETGPSQEELEQQIERRLRLQMLYSGQHTSNDSSRVEDVKQDQREKEKEKEEGQGLNRTEPISLVPWDDHFTNPSKPPLISAEAPGFPPVAISVSMDEKREKKEKKERSSLRPSSALAHTRVMHPYDIGAPIAPPIQVPFTSVREITTPLGTPSRMIYERIRSAGSNSNSINGNSSSTIIGRPETTSPVSSTENNPLPNLRRRETIVPSAVVSQNNGTVSMDSGNAAPLPVSDTPQATAANPLDDDTVGALISWAEQLDPENII